MTAKDINKESYESSTSVDTYDTRDLKGTEQYIFDKYFKAPGMILDLGCGVGRTSFALASRGLIVEAVDYSEAMIVRAQKRNSDLSSNVHFHTMNAKNLSYPSNHFDYVLFSFNGIDYLHPEADRRRALREIYRVLKPGGIFAFSSHNALFLPNNRGRIFAALKSVLFGKIYPYRLEFHQFGRLLTHYISINSQQKEVVEIGFEFLEVVSKYGKDIKKISLKDPYPTYVCRKSSHKSA